MAHTVAIEGSSEQVVAAVWSALLRRGYFVVRSFDLQNAIAQHAKGCGCPYHGALQCTCQYVVLLAYPPDMLPSPPRVFTIHTYGCATWIKLQPDRSISTGETHLLLSALAEANARPAAKEQTLVTYPIGNSDDQELTVARNN